ncbi:MAG: sugar transferase, partial [Verrucomicrobiota bacterium]
MFSDRGIKLSLRGILLFFGDLLCVAGAWYLATVLRLGPHWGTAYIFMHQSSLITCCAIFMLVFYISGMYERPALVSRRSLMGPLVASIMVSLVIIIVAFYAHFTFFIGRGILLLASLFIFLFVLTHRHLLNIAAGIGLFNKNTIVVGDDEHAENVIRLISRTRDSGYKVYGVVSCDVGQSGGFIQGVPVLGHIGKLKDFCRAYDVGTIIVAMPLHRDGDLIRVLRPLRYAGVEILDYASFYEDLAQEIPIDCIDDEWLMHAAMNSSRIHIRKLKRVMDILVAAIGLLVTLPISMIAAIAVRLDSPGKIFYRQKRAGLDNKPYTLFKFRTMREDAEKETGAVWAVKEDKRITRV